MSNTDEQNNLSNEEKKKKQAEIARRLAEIKTKLSGKSANKTKPAAKKSAEQERKKQISTDEKNTTIEIKPSFSSPAENKDVEKKQPSPPPPVSKNTPSPTPSPAHKEKTIAEKHAEKNQQQTINEQKEWKANQLRTKGNSIKRDTAPKQKEIEIKPLSKKKSRFPLVLLIIGVVLIVASGGWYFFIHTSEQSNDNERAFAEPFVREIDDTDDEMTDGETEEKAFVSKKDAAGSSPSSTTESSSSTKDKWGLKRPCYIISFVATSSERNAKKQVNILKSKGYSTGYYWIPDHLSSGPSLYKVYVGPFSSKSEARSSVGNIRRLQKDAYIQYLK